MPYAVAKDSVRLHYEEAGSGTPIIFLHEFAADHTNWEPQMRYFARGHRCFDRGSSAVNARGARYRRRVPAVRALSKLRLAFYFLQSLLTRLHG